MTNASHKGISSSSFFIVFFSLSLNFPFILFISGLNACERKSYVFLRKELPVRLSNIMKEIALLPDNLLRTSSVGLVSTWYAKSFEEVIEFEKAEPTADCLERFCSTLTKIRDRHSDVVQTMANGILELKESNDEIEPGMENSIQYFLDRFYMSRISIRMLINQHSKFDIIIKSHIN
jgi:pyruvate dehydrogenase kinase 2/3/4